MRRTIENRLTRWGVERVSIALLMVLAIAILLRQALYFDYLSDDAFISFRYARNLAEGYGLVYNPGEKVEGYSNFLWVLILSGFHMLGVDMVLTARALGVIFSVATLLLTFRLSLLIFGEGHFGNLLAPFFLAFNSSYAAWATSGMETLLFTFLITSAVYRYIREQREASSFPLSAILLALASLTRPEGVLCFGITLLHRLVSTLRQKEGNTRDDLLWVCTFLAIFVPYFLWRYWYYGYLLPNTFYAKVGGGVASYLRGLKYIVGFAGTYGGYVIFLLPLLLFLRWKQQAVLGYVFLIVISFVIYFVYIGGDGLTGYRFFVHILPLIGILLQASLLVGVGLVSLRGEKLMARIPFPLRNLLLYVAVLVLLWLPTQTPWARMVESQFVGDHWVAESRAVTGVWLYQNVPRHATIAVNAAGAIPYYSQLKTIDMLGINDLHIAHAPVQDMGKHIAGHEKSDATYVLSRRPALILPINLKKHPRGWIQWLNDSSQSIWFPGNTALVHHPDLRKFYVPRSVALTPKHYLNFFQFKNCNLVSIEEEQHWEFQGGDPQGWDSSAHFSVSEGTLTVVSGDSVTLDSPQFTLWATPADVISLRMKSDFGEQGEVFWRTRSDPNFDRLKSHQFEIIVDGQFHIYRFRMEEALFWAGMITQLRLALTDKPVKIEIDYIKVEHCPPQ